MLMIADEPATRAWFVGSFVPEILQLVLSTWQSFVLDPSLRFEQRITNSFCHALEQAYEDQGKRWFVVPEMQRTDPKTGKEIVRHDIRFFHRDIRGQRLYFVFECKRLNIRNKRGTIVPNAAGYKAGILKFVTSAYGAGHPCGGMIGYVMDGNVPSALKTVKRVIGRNRISFLIVPGTHYATSALMPHHPENGETQHLRLNGRFVLYHLLLSLH